MTPQRSTLDELTHLLINPSRLNILSTSEIGSGGYGEVYLATLDGMSRVASKQLRLVQAEGSRTRAAIVSTSLSLTPPFPLTRLSASRQRTESMGQSKTPQCPGTRRLLFERKLRLRPAYISLYGKWKYHRVFEANSSDHRNTTELCE